MRNASRFQKGSGCYTCEVCGKRTRSTGRGDNEHLRQCARCYDMGGDENAVQDGEMTVAEFDAKWGTVNMEEPAVAEAVAKAQAEPDVPLTLEELRQREGETAEEWRARLLSRVMTLTEVR